MSAKVNSTVYSMLGDFLRQKRMMAGVKQHELAKALGYKSPQFVSNWERGLCAPPLDQVPKLVGLLGVTPDTFIDVYLEIQKTAMQGLFETATGPEIAVEATTTQDRSRESSETDATLS